MHVKIAIFINLSICAHVRLSALESGGTGGLVIKGTANKPRIIGLNSRFNLIMFSGLILHFTKVVNSEDIRQTCCDIRDSKQFLTKVTPLL